MEIACRNCGTLFLSRSRWKCHCSPRCRMAHQIHRARERREAARREHPKPRRADWRLRPQTKACEVCGASYQTRSQSPERERFCSVRCRQRYTNRVHVVRHRANRTPAPWRREPRACVICGQAYLPKRPHQLCCSRPCSVKVQDAKRKAKAEAQRDKTPRTCGRCGKAFVPGPYGKYQQNCSRACTQRAVAARQAKLHPRKNRNLRRSLRAHVLERAGGKCEVCGVVPNRLDVHHKDWNWRNNDLGNLVALCTTCHDGMKVRCRVENGSMVLVSKQWQWFPPTTIVFKEA